MISEGIPTKNIVNDQPFIALFVLRRPAPRWPFDLGSIEVGSQSEAEDALVAAVGDVQDLPVVGDSRRLVEFREAGATTFVAVNGGYAFHKSSHDYDYSRFDIIGGFGPPSEYGGGFLGWAGRSQ